MGKWTNLGLVLAQEALTRADPRVCASPRFFPPAFGGEGKNLDLTLPSPLWGRGAGGEGVVSRKFAERSN